MLPMTSQTDSATDGCKVAIIPAGVGITQWKMLSIYLFLALGLLSCSPEATDADRQSSRDRTLPDFIGEHIYACPDGSQLDVDFLGDGLILDIKTSPKSRPERVTASASGKTFVGSNLNVTISGGNRITLLRPGVPPVACNRLTQRSDGLG